MSDLSLHIKPAAFSIGSLNVYWYGLMYLVGFVIVWLLLKWRIKNGEAQKLELFKNKNALVDVLFWSLVGLIVGGRLGFALFYDFGNFVDNPLLSILPSKNPGGGFSISGMSFHGGLIGIILALYFFTKNKKISFWKLADFLVPAIPAGYFFGRIGNFMNGELFGRETDVSWAINFGDGLLRHPSQLYEALFEGLALFIILWGIRNMNRFPGFISALFIAGYALARFVVEFFRQPDPQLGFIFFNLTLGQIFSVLMAIFGIGLFFIQRKKYNSGIMKKY